MTTNFLSIDWNFCLSDDQFFSNVRLDDQKIKWSKKFDQQNKMSTFDLKNETDTFGWTSIDDQCKMGT